MVSELSRIVNEHQLMGVSETEQDLVTGTDRAKAMTVSVCVWWVWGVCVCGVWVGGWSVCVHKARLLWSPLA